jgi:hypothetical protein
MTDTQEPVAPDPETEKDPAWYRDQMALKDQEIKELQKEKNRQHVKLMEDTFDKVGLDPSKGLGKAIAEKYDGEPDAEKLRNFAVEEYDWEPPPEQAENPMGQTITDAQSRVTTAIGDAQAIPLQPIDLQITEAEEKGDFATAVGLKVQKFREAQGI